MSSRNQAGRQFSIKYENFFKMISKVNQHAQTFKGAFASFAASESDLGHFSMDFSRHTVDELF